MTRIAILSLALLAAAPAAAQVQESAPTGEPANAVDASQDPLAYDLAKKKVMECAGQKFVFAWGVGAHPTKVTLCSKPGLTKAETIAWLEESAAKLAETDIPEDRRSALVAQMKGKIAELKGEAPPVASASPPPAQVPAAPVPTPQAVVAEAPAAATPAPPATLPLANVARPAPVLAAKPRLSLECISPDYPGGGPCITLSRDTILTVKSGEVVPAGVTLAFFRSGESRAELALGPMRKGQSLRSALPAQVCSGVVSGEVEIRVTRGGQVVDRLGPYLLRC